jgi:hypothetical protein
MAKKPASPDDVMTASELKPVLRLVKSEGGAEVGCAVGLTEDRDAVILVSKKEKPKRVRALLLKKAKDVGLSLNATSVRFGRATLDPADDAVLLIKINKGPTEGPLPLALRKRTKPAGFSNVVFTIDETLEKEGEEDSATSGAPVTEAHQPSTDQLQAAMERLAPGIKAAMAGHPELRAELFTASKSFVGLLRAADLSGAMHSLEDVVRLLKQAGPQTTQPAGGVDFKKAREDWNNAMEVVDAQLEKLMQKLREEDDPDLGEIAEFGMNAVTNNHRVPLVVALMEVGPGTPETLAKAGLKALAAVRAFRQHIDSDERVAACESNPFGVPVSIRATLGPALSGLEAALSTKS